MIYRYLYTKNSKAVYTYHQIFFALKVLIQNERTRWFTVRTLCSAFVQGIVGVGYSPSFFYYELLVIYFQGKNILESPVSTKKF